MDGVLLPMSYAEANELLCDSGRAIGAWQEIKTINGEDDHFVSIDCGNAINAGSLLDLASNAVEWVGDGAWRLVSIGHSTGDLDAFQAEIFNSLFSSLKSNFDINSKGGRLFALKRSAAEYSVRVRNVNLTLFVFYIMLFEHHAHIISEECRKIRYVSVEDGVLYLKSRSGDDSSASQIEKCFREGQLRQPPWVVDMMASDQT